MKLLFVDDDPRVLDGVENLLFDMVDVWEVDTCLGGVEALEMLKGGGYDVIVTDMCMPDMDGSLLLERVKELHPELIRFVLSGHAEVSCMMKAIPIAHQYLTKPCDSQTLIKHLENSYQLISSLKEARFSVQIGRLMELPPQPKAVLRINQIVSRENYTVGEIVCEIEKDMALATKILQVSNTAFFSRGNKCSSIGDAVIRLGQSNIQNIVMVLDASSCLSAAPEKALEDFYRGSLFLASLCREITQAVELKNEAFISGAMLKIGELALQSVDNTLHSQLRKRASSFEELLSLEEEVFGIHQMNLCCYIMAFWDMPHNVVHNISSYDCSDPSVLLGKNSLLSVVVAHRLYQHLFRGESQEEMRARLSALASEQQIDKWYDLAKVYASC